MTIPRAFMSRVDYKVHVELEAEIDEACDDLLGQFPIQGLLCPLPPSKAGRFWTVSTDTLTGSLQRWRRRPDWFQGGDKHGRRRRVEGAEKRGKSRKHAAVHDDRSHVLYHTFWQREVGNCHSAIRIIGVNPPRFSQDKIGLGYIWY